MLSEIQLNLNKYKPGSCLSILTQEGNQELTWGIQKDNYPLMYEVRIEHLSLPYWNHLSDNRCLLEVSSFFIKNKEFKPFKVEKFALLGIFEKNNGFVLLTIPSRLGIRIQTGDIRHPIIIYSEFYLEFLKQNNVLNFLQKMSTKWL